MFKLCRSLSEYAGCEQSRADAVRLFPIYTALEIASAKVRL